MERLKELCRLNGIELPEGALGKFEEYKELLKKWGRRINLTSLLEDREIEEKHFFDSLLGLKAFERAGIELKGRVCDVGSGAGFPGIPLAILKPDLEFLLVEPRKKRAVFLEEVKRRLSLNNVKVENKLIQEVNGDFNLLVMRAVKEPKEAVKLVSHLIERGAPLCIYRGKEGFKGQIKGYGLKEVEIKPLGVNFSRKFLFVVKV
ncbi:16S rRNA (guanine(527)-N(7))-methyltransferase RsmG [Thermovibrio sp.]